VHGTLSDIVDRALDNDFRRTGLILVGEVLAPGDFSDSKLYRQGPG
ncbi:precorrin-4 C11-methyltransferase, partial [Pseudomonas oryzihabitans]